MTEEQYKDMFDMSVIIGMLRAMVGEVKTQIKPHQVDLLKKIDSRIEEIFYKDAIKKNG